MEINVQATIGMCTEFMDDDLSEKEISVVIAPTKVTGGDKIQIVTGCNMWRSCHNPKCWYSIVARSKKT